MIEEMHANQNLAAQKVSEYSTHIHHQTFSSCKPFGILSNPGAPGLAESDVIHDGIAIALHGSLRLQGS